MSTLNILMAATEAAPFLQTGDVASVVTGLTLALRAEDHDARIIIPYYRNIAMVAQPEKIATIAVQIADFWQDAEIYRVNYQVGDASIPVYLLRNQFYFERKNPYGYLDDYERFLFFSRTIVEIFKQPNVLPDGWRPNVIHGHDWMLGLLPSWMRYTYHTEFAEHPVAFVYTIHNASYQGLSVYRALRLARLEDVGFYPQLNEQANTINFLSRGALVADAVNTVSYQHADEIKKVWYARDLARALPKGEYFRGILNGLDYAIYDPSLDSEITRFNSHTLAKRQQNKLSAQQTFGLHKDPSLPLLGITSRLIAEKGMDLLEEIVPSLIEDDHVQLVVAGEVGDFRYQEVFSDFAMRYPSQLAVPFSVAEPQLRLLYGGADMLLVPSLYEPCGLQQMIAMRYGAVPVVHDTGGLHDTVQPWGAPPTAQTNDRAAHTGRGFVFAQYSAEALLAAIHQGLNVLRTEPRQWRELQRYNMEVPNFSWDRSVAEYVKLYELAIARCSEPRSFPQGKTVTMRSPAPPTNGDLDPSDALVHAILEIDELAMNIEQRDYYRRVARLVRELLRGDTVLIWETDEADQKQLILRECSSAEDVPEDQRADLRAQIGTTKLFTEQGNRSWQYLYPLRADISGPRARAGFLGSDLARCQGWKVQLAAPVQTHGRMIGAIDVFSRNETQQYDEHDISTLSALASALAVNLEKMHLSERATRLLEIDQTLSRAQTLRDALQVALEGAIRLAHASAGRIYLTGENDELLLEALQEFELPNRQPLPIDDQIPRQASILHEPDRFVAMYNLPLQLESATTRFSEIAIPIRNSDRLVGVLDVIKLRSGAFSQEDEELLLDLAGQIAGGIQNAREREALPQNYYDTLHSLSGALAGNRDMPTLMERIVNTIGEVLGVDAASLYLADERGEQLVIQAAYGYQAKLVGRGASYAWGEGVTGKIAQSNQAFRANSLDELRQAGGSTKGKYDDEQNSKRPRSFYGLSLNIPGREKAIGVLKVESLIDRRFSDEDVLLIQMMGNIIATVVYNTQLQRQQLNQLNANLHQLSGALAGSRDMPTLMERIVNTIGEVLGVDAASLYLADERGERLVIQAAYGYQAKLVGRGASYAWGEGVTGKIAQSNESFRANSLDELRQAGGSPKGKYDDEQNSKRPRSFYGLPLNVPGREKAIGVLKVESLIDRRFSDEDVLLIQMMGNIIATVVYNTQLQRQQLNQLNANLHQLSGALAGSRDMPTLMERIVNTISEVLGVDAASLYLADERGERLVIQAAYGYQAKLVGRGASYAWGEGVTGKIAQSNRPFRANSLDELRQAGGSPKGKYDDEQNSKRPRSFYGLPLNIPGRERAIGVLKVESLIDRRFSDEDVLLIQMMGNIIATVVYNAQIDYARLVEITGLLGTLAHPQPISPHELLAEFSRSQDPTRLTLLARATAQAIGTDRERAFEEMIALGKVTVDPRLYALVAQSTTDKVIRREFELLYEGIRSDRSTPERFVDVATITHLWLSLEERRQDPTTLRVAVQRLVDFIAESFNAPATPIFSRGHWMGVVLDVHQIFENTYLPPHLGFIFYQGRRPEATDVQDLQDLSELLLRESKWKEPKLPVMVLLCGPDEDVSRTRDLLRNRLMGLRKITAITLLQMQQVIGSVHPDLALQRLVLAQIDLATISPYVTSGPLREAQIFFGRQAELHSISEHIGTTSFALIGNRKIGKTSILNRLHRALLPAVGFRTLFYSCEILEYARFLETPISGDSWQPDPPANAPATFGDLLDSPPDDRPFVLLLDEADALVRDDREHGWPIFSKIRQLADRGRLRVVLCGERILLEALFDPTGPHFNFANKLLLGPLDQKAVGNLVAQPMRGLGIDLRNENVIVTDIWNATAGHPNVVQHICNRLINRLNDRRFNSRHSKDLDRQQLTRRDVLAVVEAFDFLSQEFLPTYWGGATLLELIISLLLARAGQAAYTLLEVQQLVQDAMMHYTPGGSGAELKDLSAALDRLVDLRSILRRTPHGGYAFAFKAFPAAIVRPDVLLLDDRLAMYFEQFGKHGDITMRRS